MPVMDDALAIRISEADRLVVVGISGALDAYTAPRVTEAVHEAMKAATALLVVDTSALTFVDSEVGERSIVHADARMRCSSEVRSSCASTSSSPVLRRAATACAPLASERCLERVRPTRRQAAGCSTEHARGSTERVRVESGKFAVAGPNVRAGRAIHVSSVPIPAGNMTRARANVVPSAWTTPIRRERKRRL